MRGFFLLLIMGLSLGALRGEGIPASPRQDFVEELHGVTVADPYRWLEEVDSAETKEWVAAQNEFSEAYFASIEGREWIENKVEALWNYDKYSIPRVVADRLFYSRKSGLQNQGVLYWKARSGDGEAKVLLDQNLLSEDGTVALSGWQVSDDGRMLAYGISEGGSDWQEWRVREVDSGRDLEDRIRWVKFSGASWAPDGSGFYYSRYAEPEEGEELEAVNLNQKVYFHRLGTAQEEDRLVYERPDEPKWGFGAFVTDDDRYLGLVVWQGAGGKNAFFYRDLQAKDGPVKELISHFDSSWDFLGNDGTRFYFKTNHEAPNYRVVAIDTAKEGANWEVILPETEHPIDDVSLLGNQLLVTRLIDVLARVERYDLKGARLGEVSMPGVGSVWGFGGKRDQTETYYLFSGYTLPGSVYRYDLEKDHSELFAEPETLFPSQKYETRQVFFESRDGTRVPMFLTASRDLKRDGSNPVYLYGYGGFNISLTPYYSSSVATWLEMGGVYAVANLRGGGEYGRSWHEAGIREQKQNVFDDFQAAADYLIAENYTRPEKLAIGGGSNGGLLVGACLNQRPDLFGAAVAKVGVFDMLRFHKFTIGWAWTDDFGDPEEAADFATLLEYSPYHNTQSALPYPATLITTADHDDRVYPAHSFKFGAALQHAQSGDEPILLRIETKAGHGAGKPTSKAIEEIVDQWSFLARELEMELPPAN